MHRETVRFRDLDSLGHVNNAVFLTYLEEARIAYLVPWRKASEMTLRVRDRLPRAAPHGDELEIGVRPPESVRRLRLEYEVHSGIRSRRRRNRARLVRLREGRPVDCRTPGGRHSRLMGVFERQPLSKGSVC